MVSGAAPRLRGLYAVTPDALCREPARLLAAVEGVLAGGARLLQYRDKHNPAGVRAELARQLLGLCRAWRASLVINDDVDLAAAIGAGGVHLGSGDAPVEEARARLGAGAIVGRSCSGRVDLALAAESAGASYVAFGRFFPSRTKPDAPAAPPGLLERARPALRIPICVIGGLTPANAAPLVAAGADLVAAVDGVFGADDPEAAARAYSALFTRAK